MSDKKLTLENYVKYINNQNYEFDSEHYNVNSDQEPTIMGIEDMSNYPEGDMYPNDPRSPESKESQKESAFDDALHGNDLDNYMEMFNCAASDDVLHLLREFHRSQSTEAGNALVAKLDEMLANRIDLIFDPVFS